MSMTEPNIMIRADVLPAFPSPSIGKVVLSVHDAQRMAKFYETVVGLRRLREDREAIMLGASDTVLIELRPDASARRGTQREAGLFHTAFLLPNRLMLARWLRRAIDMNQPLLGAADHAVSEALYLVDPENNGIEIYADRPASEWRWHDGLVDMPNAPLDVDDLLKLASDHGQADDPAIAIGHVHLRVGEIAAAEHFYAGTLGLAVTQRYPGGTFYAASGYHHQLATNVWSSRGAPRRDDPATGLAEVVMRFDPADLAAIRARATDGTNAADGGLLLEDPWGTRLRLVPATDCERTNG